MPLREIDLISQIACEIPVREGIGPVREGFAPAGRRTDRAKPSWIPL